MPIPSISKPSKWFSNRSFFKLKNLPFSIILLHQTWLKLTLPLLLHSKSKSKSKSKSSIPFHSPSPSPSPSPLITPKNSIKDDELRKVFTFFDTNGDGKISSEELATYFASQGESLSNDEARRVISDFDVNGDCVLEFEEFVKLMEGESGEVNDDLRRAFEMFEVDKGSGFITPKGLQQTLDRLGDEKSYEECVAMIRVFDLDGNGVLDFHEFHRMMT